MSIYSISRKEINITNLSNMIEKFNHNNEIINLNYISDDHDIVGKSHLSLAPDLTKIHIWIELLVFCNNCKLSHVSNSYYLRYIDSNYLDEFNFSDEFNSILKKINEQPIVDGYIKNFFKNCEKCSNQIIKNILF